MRVIRTARDVQFLPKPNEERLVLSERLPPLQYCTATLALAFDNGRLLLTQDNEWGWALPGGHIERAENIEDALRRELFEETGATVRNMGVLGHTHLRILAPKPPGYKYPYPDSYIVFFWAQIGSLETFEETSESRGRHLFGKGELEEVYRDFDAELYEAALKAVADHAHPS